MSLKFNLDQKNEKGMTSPKPWSFIQFCSVICQVMYIEIDANSARWNLRDRHNKIFNTGAIFHGNLVVCTKSNKNKKSWLSVAISKVVSVPGLHCVYLHGGAVALVSISKPAFPCCTLVQVNVLNVDIHTDHTSKAEHTDSGGVGHRCVTKQRNNSGSTWGQT